MNIYKAQDSESLYICNIRPHNECCVTGHRHKLPTVEPPRPLLEDLQFGPLANFQRSLAGASFAAGGLHGNQPYSGAHFSPPGMSFGG